MTTKRFLSLATIVMGYRLLAMLVLPVKATRRLNVLNALTGGLSNPSKMPGYSFSLPAKECITGSKLRAVAGSVCHGCYAMRGRYVFPNVQAALYRRLAAVQTDEWLDAMVESVLHYTQPCESAQCPLGATVGEHGHMRLHDSGDLQNQAHLGKYAELARRTPSIYYWLPTREYKMVREWLAENTCPTNLNIRLSAHMIGGSVPTFRNISQVTISTVTAHETTDEGAYNCPSRHQGNKCGDCRACWLPEVRRVNYIKH